MSKMTKAHCAGCYHDEYNRGLGGAKECWSFKTAELKLRKKVHVDQMPPWKQEPQKYPSCYYQQRYVFINEGRTE